jgi:hypothetical protein
MLLTGVLTAGRAGAEPPSFDDANVGLIRELMRRRGGDPAAMAQLVQLTRSCSPTKTAELFEELAAAHRLAGNLNLAAQTRQTIVERFPEEPAARAALLWLVRLYASSEVARAQQPPAPAAIAGPRALVAAEQAPRLALAESAAAGKADDGEQAMPAYALMLAAKATMARPVLDSDPALAFQRAVAARRTGDDKAAQGWLIKLKHARPGEPWGECARAETWLAESREGRPPKPTAHCVRTADAPHLDGDLSDSCWQGEAMPVGGPGGAEVRWAYDDEYLYVAVRCAKAAGVGYPRDDRPRTHDGDVDSYDHVRLLVDLDRDYASWFELSIDSRGWTADRAWDDAAWNPPWFVAAGEAGGAENATDAWTAEAAISLAELGAAPLSDRSAWACRVERRLPGAEVTAWPAVASEAREAQRLGLLLFD